MYLGPPSETETSRVADEDDPEKQIGVEKEDVVAPRKGPRDLSPQPDRCNDNSEACKRHGLRPEVLERALRTVPQIGDIPDKS